MSRQSVRTRSMNLLPVLLAAALEDVAEGVEQNIVAGVAAVSLVAEEQGSPAAGWSLRWCRSRTAYQRSACRTGMRTRSSALRSERARAAQRLPAEDRVQHMHSAAALLHPADSASRSCSFYHYLHKIVRFAQFVFWRHPGRRRGCLLFPLRLADSTLSVKKGYNGVSRCVITVLPQ